MTQLRFSARCAFWLLASVAGLFAQGAPDSRGPESVAATRLAFQEVRHDFGHIRDDHPVSWKFGFTNGGTVPLTISDVHSSCGCTTTTLAKKTFAPGESGEIDAHFDPVNRQGKEQKTITVKTTEPGTKPAELTILVDVIPRIGVDPPAVFLGEVPVDVAPADYPKKQLVITSRVPEFAVRSASLDDERFAFSALPPVPGEADGDKVTRFTYEISLARNLPIGRYQAMVNLATNDALRPQIGVPVVVEAYGELRLAPSALTLQMPRPGISVENTVIVTTRGGKPFHVLDAVISGGDPMTLRTEFGPFMPKSETAWRVRVLGTSPAAGTRVAASLRLKTDVAAQPEIEIPITGYVLKESQVH
jgi:hypothetical protein